MLVMLGVGMLVVGWGFCVVMVLSLVRSVSLSLNADWGLVHQTADLVVGLTIVLILSLAPLAIIIFLRVN